MGWSATMKWIYLIGYERRAEEKKLESKIIVPNNKKKIYSKKLMLFILSVPCWRRKMRKREKNYLICSIRKISQTLLVMLCMAGKQAHWQYQWNTPKTKFYPLQISYSQKKNNVCGFFEIIVCDEFYIPHYNTNDIPFVFEAFFMCKLHKMNEIKMKEKITTVNWKRDNVHHCSHKRAYNRRSHTHTHLSIERHIRNIVQMLSTSCLTCHINDR